MELAAVFGVAGLLAVVAGVIAGTTTGIGDWASLIEANETAARREKISKRMLFRPSPSAGINSRLAQRLGNRHHLRINFGLIVRDRGLLVLHFFGEGEGLLLFSLGFF